jgi:transcriptional regulator
MYRPKQFDVNDPAQLAEIMHRYSFATIVTHDGTAPFATHVPVLFHADVGPHGTLVTHMARANPQWRHFANGQEVLVIFQGPHAYISPSWYAKQPDVPTWNYAAVHAYGVPSLVEDTASVRSLLMEMVAAFENSRPDPYTDKLPAEYVDKLSPALVGFEIQITRLEGKFKLSQNRSDADRMGVIAALQASPDQTDRELAELMSKRESTNP